MWNTRSVTVDSPIFNSADHDVTRSYNGIPYANAASLLALLVKHAWHRWNIRSTTINQHIFKSAGQDDNTCGYVCQLSWWAFPPFPSSVCSTVYGSIVCFLHTLRRNHYHHHRKNYMYRQLMRFDCSVSWIDGNTSKRSCGLSRSRYFDACGILDLLQSIMMILGGVITTHLTARNCVR